MKLFLKKINLEPNQFSASVLLITLMNKYNLDGWTYQFQDNLYMTGGYTDANAKVIVISKNMIMSPKTTYKDLEQVILHEIAHAIDKCKNNHNKIWWDIAKKIGYKRKTIYCHNFTTLKDYKHIKICRKGCKIGYFKYSKKRRYCKRHKCFFKNI